MLALKHISHSPFLKMLTLSWVTRYTDFIYSGFYDIVSTHIDWEEAMRHWSDINFLYINNFK